jgi:hypothetical protein
LQCLIEHSGISGTKSLAHLCDQLQGLGHRSHLALEQACIAKGIVAANAQDKMRGIARTLLQLLGYVRDHGAVERVQGGAPAGGQDVAKLAHDIWPAALLKMESPRRTMWVMGVWTWLNAGVGDVQRRPPAARKKSCGDGSIIRHTSGDQRRLGSVSCSGSRMAGSSC